MNELDTQPDEPSRLTSRVNDAVQAIRSRCSLSPSVGIVLGTGLGSLADQIDVVAEWPYAALPHFARSTAEGHRGRLRIGHLNNVSIVAMDGRFHRYEGYSFEDVTFPIQVLAKLGTQLLIVSNASGGLNPEFNSGDIVLIEDYINLMWPRPAGSGREETVETELAERFSSRRFRDTSRMWLLCEQSAAAEQISLRRGTYIAMLGPNYETRAEYRWLRTLGDVVGMSTVPELLVADDLRLPTIAFSIVANVYRPDVAEVTTSNDVQNSVAMAAPRLQRLVCRLLATLFNPSLS